MNGWRKAGMRGRLTPPRKAGDGWDRERAHRLLTDRGYTQWGNGPRTTYTKDGEVWACVHVYNDGAEILTHQLGERPLRKTIETLAVLRALVNWIGLTNWDIAQSRGDVPR